MADNIHRDKDAHEVSESESGDNQDGSVTSQPENNHGDELKYENGMENDVEIQIEEAVKGDVCNANENAIKGEVKIEQVKIVTEHENDKNSDLLEDAIQTGDSLSLETNQKTDDNEKNGNHDAHEESCHEKQAGTELESDAEKQNEENESGAIKRCKQEEIENQDVTIEEGLTKEQSIPSSSQDTESNEAQKPVKTSTCSSKLDPSQSVYYLKRFQWRGEHIQIVTQNENGPCPLLAIANVLVLSKRISLPSVQECITGNQLMEHIGDYILSSGPQNVDEAIILNYQQNMHDAISIMYKLQTGIDVNVQFTGPRHFELTPECLVFDILNIGLYHGWLVDPQDSRITKAVSNLSYNQLVEKIIKSKDGNSDEEMIEEGLLAENFLEQTASQLTYHGLCELNSEIKEEELCVFFRNNHFSTLYKHKGELFLLVTDQGYLNQSKIIWETLVNVDGDGQFVNENFYTVGPIATPQIYHEKKPQTHDLTQEDRDYLIALSLQEENRVNSNPTNVSQQNEQPSNVSQHQVNKDLELARRLQEEENRMAREEQQLRQQQQHRQQQHHQQQQMPHMQHQQPANQPLPRQHQQPQLHADGRNERCTIL